MVFHKSIADISKARSFNYEFSVCSLVRNHDKYAEMVNSFVAAGFDEDVEYLYVDNSATNQFSAYSGLSHLLAYAKGRYIVLCHEDVKLINDDRSVLEERLSQLTSIDSSWALAGNAGALPSGRLVERITNRYWQESCSGPFPSYVISLDENFIVVRGGIPIGFSSDLTGFHMYGLDICLHARLMGHTSYVIDFHLLHEGRGERGEAFYSCLDQFEAKWSKHLRPQLLFTTCALVALSPTKRGRRLMKRSYLARLSLWFMLANLVDSVREAIFVRRFLQSLRS